MKYDRQQAIDFWYEFDNYFMFKAPQEIIDAYNILFSIGDLRHLFRTHRRNGTYPEGFKVDVSPVRDTIIFLAQKQLDIIEKYFKNRAENERKAFEDFGQGVLYDDRRNPPDKIHKMDGGRNNPPIGYHRWHAFIRALVIIGGEGEEEKRWLEIDRNLGLAWEIQSILKPQDDNPNNPELPVHRLNQLQTIWLSKSFDLLDIEFDSFPYPRIM
jgi:hypothetical protein